MPGQIAGVQLVIADTGPINYLVLIGHIQILPTLFQRIVVPSAVWSELTDADAPAVVQRFIESQPAWLEIMESHAIVPISGLHRGESAAITLAGSLEADMLLIDDRKAVKVARAKGFHVTGTLGLLEMASKAGLVDFGDAARLLKQTTFRSPDALVLAMIERNRKKDGV